MLGRRRVDQRCFRPHFHSFRDITQLENKAGSHALSRRQSQAGLAVGLEAGSVDFQCVGSALERRESELADVVRCYNRCGTGSLVGRGHFGTGDGRP